MTTVTIRFFARARDLAGADFVTVELPDGATVADIRRRLAAQILALETFMPRCAVAVNEQFADDDVIVPRHAEVALLPPVSGG
jgi:molybdopterin converting factor subunit 1